MLRFVPSFASIQPRSRLLSCQGQCSQGQCSKGHVCCHACECIVAEIHLLNLTLSIVSLHSVKETKYLSLFCYTYMTKTLRLLKTCSVNTRSEKQNQSGFIYRKTGVAFTSGMFSVQLSKWLPGILGEWDDMWEVNWQFYRSINLWYQMNAIKVRDMGREGGVLLWCAMLWFYSMDLF